MWKENWEETKQHFTDWWNHKGLVVGMWGAPANGGHAHEQVQVPPSPQSIRDAYTDTELRARRNHYELSRRAFPADTLPLSDTDMGPGSLATFMGATPGFSPETVWFEPCLHNCDSPDALPAFRFDDSNPWWRITEATVKACVNVSAGKYLVGCPDLVENIDILAALRDPQTLMMDLVERPEWVEQKVAEINQVWFKAYQRIYDVIKLDDGSSAFGAFRLWGPGKTAKLQCDASAMFSTNMFNRFVMPSLTEQCEWLDFSMYHLDGTQAVCHLDSLLQIEALDAIEWTPQAGIENGGHHRWFPLYKRILDAGKSVQIVGAAKEDIPRILDTLGGEGVYIMTWFDATEAEQVMSMVEAYR